MSDAALPQPDVLRTIFTRPRPTVQWLVAHGEGRALTRALFVAQMIALELVVLSRVTSWVAGRTAWVVPAADAAFARYALTLAAIAAVAWCPLVALATRLVGGRAPTRATMRALVWGHAPLAIALPLLLLAFVAEHVGLLAGRTLVAPLYAGFALWSLVLSTITIAEANRLPLVRSALALFAAVFLTEVVVAAGSLTLPRLIFGAGAGAP